MRDPNPERGVRLSKTNFGSVSTMREDDYFQVVQNAPFLIISLVLGCYSPPRPRPPACRQRSGSRRMVTMPRRGPSETVLTLERARDAVRAVNASRQDGRKYDGQLRGGTYRLASPLLLDWRDSGGKGKRSPTVRPWRTPHDFRIDSG